MSIDLIIFLPIFIFSIGSFLDGRLNILSSSISLTTAILMGISSILLFYTALVYKPWVLLLYIILFVLTLLFYFKVKDVERQITLIINHSIVKDKYNFEKSDFPNIHYDSKEIANTIEILKSKGFIHPAVIYQV